MARPPAKAAARAVILIVIVGFLERKQSVAELPQDIAGARALRAV
jgi:hypothetical protein